MKADVFFDNSTGKLIYVLNTDDAAIKGVVEFDYRIKKSDTKLNGIVSGYRQSAKEITERIKRGDWTKLI